MGEPISEQSDSSKRTALVYLVATIATILIGYTLKLTQLISLPIALAFFAAVLVYPVQRAVNERLRRERHWLGVVAAMAVILVAFALLASALGYAVSLFSARAGHYGELIQARWIRFLDWANLENLDFFGEDGLLRDAIAAWLNAFLHNTYWLVGLLLLVFFFTLLMLVEVPEWQTKSDVALGPRRAQEAVNAVATVARRVRQFLVVRSFIGSATAALQGSWLWAIGVELVFVWTLLFFVLNYIPALGSILAAIPPIVVAFVLGGWSQALLAAGGLFLIDQVMGNYVDPWVQGERLVLSPLVILVSIVLWGWIWGVIGAFIAVPMTVTVLVGASRIPTLEPIAFLLSRAGSRRQLRKVMGKDD